MYQNGPRSTPSWVALSLESEQMEAPDQPLADGVPPERARRSTKAIRRVVVVGVGAVLLGLLGPLLISTDSSAKPRPAFENANTIPVPLSDAPDTGLLRLVNAEHAVPEGSPDLVEAWPTVPVAVEGIRLRPEALAAVSRLFEAARAEGIGSFFISSGYRDAASQQLLWDNAPDRGFVQPAGHSEHQTGLAADIMAVGLAQDEMAGSAQARWLEENAPLFGLILRYPVGSEDITGIAHEPWHFRYVGQPHAAVIADRGFTLEEYLHWLRESGGFATEVAGMSYRVWLAEPVAGAIAVPADWRYLVSSTITGAYVVTAWQ